MISTIFGIFLILHGIVHLLYLTLSQGIIEDESISWGLDSWLWGEVENPPPVKTLALILYALTILIFVLAGILYLVNNSQWLIITYLACVISTVTVVLFWDGTFQSLPDQGFIGILINIGIILLIQFYDPILNATT